MRPSLLPGLIAAARRNLDRGAPSVRLFEVGRRYLADAEHPTLGLHPRRRQAGRAAGRRARRKASTRSTPRPRCSRCSMPPARRSTNLQVFADAGPTWHPGRSATLRARPEDHRRRIRRASPRVCRRASTRPAGAVAAEIYLDAIPQGRASGHARAGLCAAGAAGGDARLRLHRPRRRPVRHARPRDPRRRQGGDRRRPAVRPVRSARRACRLAFEVTLQPAEKSFTDEQIAEISKRIVAAAEKLGARLRS